jgi:hypothetical protein
MSFFSPLTAFNIVSLFSMLVVLTIICKYKKKQDIPEAIGIGKDFLSRTKVAQQLRKRMDKWDHMRLKSFCTTKEMVSELKWPPTD